MKTIFIAFLSISLFVARSQDTLILQPGPDGKDALLNSYYTGNYGDYPNLWAIAGTHSGDPFTCRAIFEFDLSAIVPDAEILEARLSLYFANNPSTPYFHYGDNGSYLQRVTEFWDEFEVTWYNQPQTTDENQVYLPVSTYETQDYTDIDVTALIQDIVSDPENSHGIMLRLNTEEIYRRLMFASGDNEDPFKRPRLEIIFTGCPLPAAEFEYEADSLTYTFTGISATALTWHWDFGDGDTSNLQNPIHNFAAPGFYEVCLHLEDTCYFANHCETIEICFQPPQTGFTYFIEGSDVFFQDSSQVANEFYWDFGDGYFSSLRNPAHTYDHDGSYQVCLTASNSCGSDTFCQVIDICIPPVSGFNYVFDNLTVYFGDLSLNAEEYYWDFGDSYYSNLANPWHEYESHGAYLVCLTTYNSCGTDEICQIINLSTVNIIDIGVRQITIYPNPARNEIFIKTGLSGLYIFNLIDLSGKVLLKQELELIQDQVFMVNLNDILPGIYFIKLVSEENHFFEKIVVTR